MTTNTPSIALQRSNGYRRIQGSATDYREYVIAGWLFVVRSGETRQHGVQATSATIIISYTDPAMSDGHRIRHLLFG